MSQPQHELFFDRTNNIYYDQDGRVYPAQQVYFSHEHQALIYDPGYSADPGHAAVEAAPSYEGGYETTVAPRYGGGYETSVPPPYQRAARTEPPVCEHQAPEYAEPDPAEVKPKPTFYIQNLGSLRVWFSAMLGAFILTAILLWLLNLVWVTPAFLTFSVFVVLFVPILWGLCLDSPAYCPHCRKRVKLNATRCHHCAADFS